MSDEGPSDGLVQKGCDDPRVIIRMGQIGRIKLNGAILSAYFFEVVVVGTKVLLVPVFPVGD
jgi:hypothetical protein